MAGVKGRSGRKTKFHEVQEGKLEQVCSKWILDKWDEFDDKTRIRIALAITPKMVTQRSESTITTQQAEEKQLDLITKAIRLEKLANQSERN